MCVPQNGIHVYMYSHCSIGEMLKYLRITIAYFAFSIVMRTLKSHWIGYQWPLRLRNQKSQDGDSWRYVHTCGGYRCSMYVRIHVARNN